MSSAPRRDVTFGISLPQVFDDGAFDPYGFRTYVRKAESLGFESAWAGEQILGDVPHYGPIETLTYAAACSTTLRLGCAMLISSLHSPLHLAKSIATLDQLSRGRVEVGLAAGGGFRMFPAFGLRREGFVVRFLEGLDVMNASWTQRDINVDGRFFQISSGAMEPKPFQKPRPPIWLGGNHPNAVLRALRHADGFFGAGSTTTSAFADQVRHLREELTRRPTHMKGFRIAKRVYIAVDDHADRAQRRITEALDRFYGYFGLRNLEPVAVSGTPQSCVEGLLRVVGAGAELIVLNPLFDDTEQMERLAVEIVPEVLERVSRGRRNRGLDS